MTLDDVQQKLAAKFPSAVLERIETKPDPFLKIEPSQVHPVLSFLRDELQFETLNDLCGADHVKDNLLAVVYHPFSYRHKLIVCLKIYLPRDGTPTVRSVSDIYQAANWLERETYDMFGIHFEQHPDHRRILCPEDWQGYPLRKDYEVPDYYNGMPVPLFYEENEPTTPNPGEHSA